MNKNIVRYHVTKNLQSPMNLRVSLDTRLRRSHVTRVARDYAQFRESMGNLSTRNWDNL